MKLVSRISIKNCECDLANAKDKNLNLMQVIGIARKIEIGTSTYGDWVKFRGSFEAVNLQTGEVYSSANCFLPKIAQDLILDGIESLIDKGSVEVSFAFQINSKPANSAIGYEYEVKPLIETAKNDALEELRKVLELPSSVKMLKS